MAPLFRREPGLKPWGFFVPKNPPYRFGISPPGNFTCALSHWSFVQRAQEFFWWPQTPKVLLRGVITPELNPGKYKFGLTPFLLGTGLKHPVFPDPKALKFGISAGKVIAPCSLRLSSQWVASVSLDNPPSGSDWEGINRSPSLKIKLWLNLLLVTVKRRLLELVAFVCFQCCQGPFGHTVRLWLRGDRSEWAENKSLIDPFARNG